MQLMKRHSQIKTIKECPCLQFPKPSLPCSSSTPLPKKQKKKISLLYPSMKIQITKPHSHSLRQTNGGQICLTVCHKISATLRA